jgi:hypothetical protein
MTDAEKEQFLDIWRRQQEGYRIAQHLRERALPETVTPVAVATLMGAFEYSAKHPVPRKRSGLVEFYQAMKKTLPSE